MPIEVFNEFERRTGITILEGYGLTEGTTASCINPRDGERRVGSIGIRFPYQDMKTVKLSADGTYERDCAVDEVGAICISGPNVFPGYRQERYNEGIWVEDGWLNTGDLGRQDADGYFWLTGRAKDLIIRGGHNIDPALIEEALHRHPAVALAAAVGMPDAYAGELPVAYVELKPGAEADAGELRTFAKETVAERPAAPAEVFVVDSMPVTAVGKIFKPALRHDAVRRVYEAALAPLCEGDVTVAVEVGPDDRFGTLARVTFTGVPAKSRDGLSERVAETLGAYTIRHTVDWA